MTWESTKTQNYKTDSFKKYNDLPRPVCSAAACSRDAAGKRNVGRKKCLGCSFAGRFS